MGIQQSDEHKKKYRSGAINSRMH